MKVTKELRKLKEQTIPSVGKCGERDVFQGNSSRWRVTTER